MFRLQRGFSLLNPRTHDSASVTILPRYRQAVVTFVANGLLLDGDCSLPIPFAYGKLVSLVCATVKRPLFRTLRIIALALLIVPHACDFGSEGLRAPTGLAWNVSGTWQDVKSGKQIVTGSLVLPGSLVAPIKVEEAHSLTVLLPDGQRVLNECFTAQDCSRGFRIPPLTSRPPGFSSEMLDRMRRVIAQRQNNGKSDSSRHNFTTRARQGETVAVLAAQTGRSGPAMYEANNDGAVDALPGGSYTYDLRLLGGSWYARSQQPLQKKNHGYLLFLPAAGLYQVSIFDGSNIERVELLVAAVQPEDAYIIGDFAKAQKVLGEWDETYSGWPIHALLRAYLQSFPKLMRKADVCLSCKPGSAHSGNLG